MKINKQRIKEFAKNVLGFEIFNYQLNFISDCFEKQYVLACWSRQIGKSTSCSLFASLYAILNENKTVIIIARGDRQSKELYYKILQFVHKVPEFEKTVNKETQDETLLNNGSRILNLPCGDDGSYIRGYSADVVILDECAFIPDIIVNEVISPFLATRDKGKMIKLSTPRGKAGHFYKSYCDKDYAVHKYDYSYGVKAGLISQSFIDKKRQEMDALSFAQEYGADFIDEASCYLPHSLLDQNIQDCVELPV